MSGTDILRKMYASSDRRGHGPPSDGALSRRSLGECGRCSSRWTPGSRHTTQATLTAPPIRDRFQDACELCAAGLTAFFLNSVIFGLFSFYSFFFFTLGKLPGSVGFSWIRRGRDNFRSLKTGALVLLVRLFSPHFFYKRPLKMGLHVFILNEAFLFLELVFLPSTLDRIGNKSPLSITPQVFVRFLIPIFLPHVLVNQRSRTSSLAGRCGLRAGPRRIRRTDACVRAGQYF